MVGTASNDRESFEIYHARREEDRLKKDPMLPGSAGVIRDAEPKTPRTKEDPADNEGYHTIRSR
jgi:hypothetical protein